MTVTNDDKVTEEPESKVIDDFVVTDPVVVEDDDIDFESYDEVGYDDDEDFDSAF